MSRCPSDGMFEFGHDWRWKASWLPWRAGFFRCSRCGRRKL